MADRYPHGLLRRRPASAYPSQGQIRHLPDLGKSQGRPAAPGFCVNRSSVVSVYVSRSNQVFQFCHCHGAPKSQRDPDGCFNGCVEPDTYERAAASRNSSGYGRYFSHRHQWRSSPHESLNCRSDTRSTGRLRRSYIYSSVPAHHCLLGQPDCHRLGSLYH